MTNQHRTQYRHPKAHTVIPMTTPVFGKFFQHVHSRLQIRTNITVFPIEGTDDEADSEFQSMLHIFVSGCKALNALEMRIEEEIGKLEEVVTFEGRNQARLIELKNQFDRAMLENETHLQSTNVHFRNLMQKYQDGKNALERIRAKEKTRPDQSNRAFRISNRIDQQRRELDEILRSSSSQLPYPTVKTEESESNGVLSIDELINEIQRIEHERRELLAMKRHDIKTVIPILTNHFFDSLYSMLSDAGLKRLGHPLANGRLHLYEVEDTLACREIQTDENGLPTDAETTPIAVSMNVIRYAIETGTEVLHEGSFAFIPKAIDGEESNGLIGAFDGGHVKLAILPPSVIKMILACEERWLKQVESSIRSTYQQPAPATGAQIQEHEESFDGPSSNAPTDESASHAEQPKGTTETSFPHFELEPDP